MNLRPIVVGLTVAVTAVTVRTADAHESSGMRYTLPAVAPPREQNPNKNLFGALVRLDRLAMNSCGTGASEQRLAFARATEFVGRTFPLASLFVPEPSGRPRRIMIMGRFGRGEYGAALVGIF